jgi:hypothetical protein
MHFNAKSATAKSVSNLPKSQSISDSLSGSAFHVFHRRSSRPGAGSTPCAGTAKLLALEVT